jgi:hypothetical protein
VRIKYPAPIEAVIEDARWSLAEHLWAGRTTGMTYQRLAEREKMDRATVRRSVRTYEREVRRRYESGDVLVPSCNRPELACRVCGTEFTATRADARYCSNACRQDAYRKRKVGADPLSPAERQRLAALEQPIQADAA